MKRTDVQNMCINKTQCKVMCCNDIKMDII